MSVCEVCRQTYLRGQRTGIFVSHQCSPQGDFVEENFNNYMIEMTHSVEPSEALSVTCLTRPNGLKNKACMEAGVEVIHDSTVWSVLLRPAFSMAKCPFCQW